MSIGFDFTGGSMPPGAALTRGSTGARTNSAGFLVWESIDVPRFDYDPSTHAPLGILAEPAATNRILQSSSFENSAWTKQGVSVTANAGMSPTGATVADKLLIDNANSVHVLTQIPNATGAQTLSVYVSSLGARYFYFYSIGRNPNDTVNQPFAAFDLQTATIIGSTGGLGAFITLGPGGLYRISVIGSSSSPQREFRFGFSNAALAQTFTGNGTDSVLVWGAQLETGMVATTPIDTTSATATRAADILTLNWGLLGVGDGAITVRYTFDDNSTQDVATTISGGTSVVPTNLNRPRIKSAVGVGVTVPDTLNNPSIFPILPGQEFPVTKSPVWSTQVATASSGRERRRKQWSYPKWRFKISHEVLRDTASFLELQRLWAFFNAKAGQYAEFSFFDAADNSVADQVFGTGDGIATAFQLARTMSAGAMAFTEPVRSVAGLPTIKINGVATSAFTLGANGQVSFVSPPAASAALSWSGQFMFLVRFEQDELEAEQMMQSLWSQGGLTLVTVKK